jgi:hypothetical protein
MEHKTLELSSWKATLHVKYFQNILNSEQTATEQSL